MTSMKVKFCSDAKWFEKLYDFPRVNHSFMRTTTLDGFQALAIIPAIKEQPALNLGDCEKPMLELLDLVFSIPAFAATIDQASLPGHARLEQFLQIALLWAILGFIVIKHALTEGMKLKGYGNPD